MNHRRLTDLTAVLAGTAVFFTILAAAGTKKAAQAVSGTVRTAAVVCTGRSAMMRPKPCRRRFLQTLTVRVR